MRYGVPHSVHRSQFLMLLTGIVACGGGDAPGHGTAATASTTPESTRADAASAAIPPATPATGATHDVKMIGDDKGYRFEPADVTIHTGDAVRWMNVSGGPHNASFWADSLPTGTAAQLGAQMPNTTSPLVGPLLVEPNAAYTVSFAGLRPGTYRYYCTPHLALGMRGTVTVIK